MRSIIWLMVALLCGNISSYAQKAATPEKVKQAFAAKYPGSSHVKWEQEGKQYEVSFDNKGTNMSVLYDANGTVTETETQIPAAKLPEAARKYATAKGTIKEAARIEAANGKTTYEAEVNGTDLLFDEQGRFIKEKKDKD